MSCVFTSRDLKSGTDRICEGLSLLPDFERPRDMDIVLNVQGDEPFFSVLDLTRLTKKMLEEPNLPMGTLGFERRSTEFFLKSSVVKIVTNSTSQAVYFSRAPVPWPRQAFGASGQDWLEKCKNSEDILFIQHLGVYAFRYHALESFAHHLPESTLENQEGLEQLRAVEAGWPIAVVKATEAPFGIDTLDDLERARAFCEKNKDV